MLSSSVHSILDSIEQLPDPVRVGGTTSAVRAYLLAHWIAKSERPLLVVCPDDDLAAELLQDVETALALIGQTKSEYVLRVPTWEQSPYSTVSPSLKARHLRIAALAGIHQLLSQEGRQGVIITSIAAICQSTLSLSRFQSNSLKFDAGASIGSRDLLIRKLLQSAYERVDPVEDPGTFAVRGEIIDLFPPGQEMPIRIELFDDVIERIRHFSPSDQRTSASEENLQSVVVPPAREILIQDDTIPRLRTRIKLHADERAIPRKIRDPISESIEVGSYPGHSDTWVPFAEDPAATLLDHIPSEWPVIWSDELACMQAIDDFLRRQKELDSVSGEHGLIVPAAEELFRWSPTLEAELRRRSRIYLDQLSIRSENKHLSLSIHTNADLRGGNRRELSPQLETAFQNWLDEGYSTAVICASASQVERIRFLLERRGVPVDTQGAPKPGRVFLSVGVLSAGFRWPKERVAWITEQEILGTVSRKSNKAQKRPADWAGLQALSDLSTGDAIVHIDHGIGRYLGLSRIHSGDAAQEFLVLEYAGQDKLYLPVDRLNQLQKYIGGSEHVKLDQLGSRHFEKAKNRVREAVRELAFDLLKLYAERSLQKGAILSIPEPDHLDFAGRFPFEETPDQSRAIDDVLSDLQSGKVMDRLVCGDVGFGKTEVAMRAAFTAVTAGKQVVVLVPATVLCFQHEQSFRERMKDYPIRIESISRFRNSREQKTVLKDLSEGKIDILIGTHRVLSKDISFRDLGLVIVDEEHRFGVDHKERLKLLRKDTHVLTMTATPIPRTLHMALSGIKDISLITTPPVDRLPIRTYVSAPDEDLIKRAVEHELNRGGQVFFLHNRVQSIYETASTLRELVPKSRIAVGHGQMSEGELEKTMLAFYRGESNVLVCTTIIESGLDVPSANTIVINHAERFGLAQLYQLRGRVGRSNQRAYAYLLVSDSRNLTADARRRLEVIQRFVELGSGFQIASHDLEIRGGGNILGPQQSGHIAAVGFELYMEMLEEAIQDIKTDGTPSEPRQAPDSKEPELKLPYSAFLDESYVPDVHQRLSLYRRLSSSRTDTELQDLEIEMQDRFGPLPKEAQNLFWVIRIKQLLRTAGFEALIVGPDRFSVTAARSTPAEPKKVLELIGQERSKYSLMPDSRLVVTAKLRDPRDLYFEIENLWQKLNPTAKL